MMSSPPIPITPEWRQLANALPHIVWAADAAGDVRFFNCRWHDFTGAPIAEPLPWLEWFHPDEQAAITGHWLRSLASGEPYEIEYRIRRHDGSWHWHLGRGVPVRDAGGAIAWWLGTCTDIAALKAAEAQRTLIARELTHRIRNIFAVVGALVSLSARGQPGLGKFVDGVRRRLSALATAHDLVRPGEEGNSLPPATLHSLLAALLEPYDNQRVAIAGMDRPVGPGAATSLALVFHELATNAVKYGALGNDGGRISIRSTSDADLCRIQWRESGGPPLAGPPASTGFGSQLSRYALAAWPGASLTLDWLAAGLQVTLAVPCGQLAL
jgi:PAS domain S-box-containing protein